jgi:hypothetical protein
MAPFEVTQCSMPAREDGRRRNIDDLAALVLFHFGENGFGDVERPANITAVTSSHPWTPQSLSARSTRMKLRY